uniref:zinc finger protein 638-like isoform X2 n=1 Tax=Monopterus albus TaxID=43700 RepID=UPI0009B4936A|nr:zinc finger protein 638-like isoform X2 [Monopterus albus]
MYHHHSQQQGSQPFSNGPRPPHHQPPPNQHQNRTPSDMLSQVMGFQFPRPTQLPDEIESALAIRGTRDIDHRLIDHMNQPSQHQNQGSGSGVSQHGSYGTNPVTLPSDNQPVHQQGVDWSGYQPPTKLFASPPPTASCQSQEHQGPQQQPQSSHTGPSIPGWTAPVSDSPLPQARHPPGSGSGGGGDGQSLYTPECAGSILASFGLSNEDLEVLSHYPDDQLTPDTLPFILRDIQINKSGNQKAMAPTSSFSHNIHDLPLPPSHSLARSESPEVPSLLTVTQTAGKVIDYGHASRTNEESSTRETFKRGPLSSERTVKIYPSSSSSSATKAEKAEKRQVNVEHIEPSKHGDRDYRRTSRDHRKSTRSPGREFPPSTKSRNLDQDYRRDGPKPRPLSETQKEDSSRRSLSSSSESKPPSSSKKFPTPTMISDFSAVSPKAYPHTCSLCHIECDQEKDWVDHINTVNHTAACRDLRNKYPYWKPILPSRSGRYGSRALWDPKDGSPFRPGSRSLSTSPPPGPPHNTQRVAPHPHRPRGKPYSPPHHLRHHHYAEHGHQLERHHSGSHSPPHSRRTSREYRPDKRDRESSGVASRSGVKRPHDDSVRCFTDADQHPFSNKASQSSKYGSSQSTKTIKSGVKPGTKMTKRASATAPDTTAKPPPAKKKKKKVVTPASQHLSVADRLVYLTGIPNDASEQEVTDLVGSFGRINNVILMPCSEEEKGERQKASVCMLRAEDAQAVANSINLSIRDQQITASLAKKPEGGQSSDANNSKPSLGWDKGAAGEDAGGEADQKASGEMGVVLITGLPESGWSESDIIQLVQPFGTPSDIILATQVGKVLVSMPDTEIAQEIVKVHTFIPAKINDSEVKIIHLKQRIGLSTPVALYNLLMGSVDPLENTAPVGWGRLLVISNVPDTPPGSAEVQKLVRRFGTVIKTLVLNNMVICEMATVAMALSVYRRFQTFPCIIQNNPLFFSRKPDPKANAQTKVIAAYIDSSEGTPANAKGSQTVVTVGEEEMVHKEKSESPMEEMDKDIDGKDAKIKSTEEVADKNKDLEENKSKNDEIQKDELTNAAVALDAPEADLDTDMRERSAVQAVMETAEGNEEVCASEVENDKIPAVEEATLPSSNDKAASEENRIPELPKVTQEMVNALLEECRTKTTSHPSNTTVSPCEVQGETQMETGQGKKAREETKEPAKNHTEEEVKQERERKDREARKERERKERERRPWEKEERYRRERERDERVRREREKREEERRQWERRERERRERKRAYGGCFTGSRSSCRLERYKQSSWRDEYYDTSEADAKMEDNEEEEFPFNLSDFVTLDEVGDVTDLPCSPSPTALVETTEGEDDTPASVQQDTPEETPMEVTTGAVSDITVDPVKSDEQESESQAVSVPAAEISDDLSSDLTTNPVLITAASPIPASQPDSCSSITDVPTHQSEAAETETQLIATVDSIPEVEHLSTPAPAASGSPHEDAPVDSSHSPTTGVVTAESKQEEKDGSAVSHSQVKEEKMVVEEEQEKMQDDKDKETGAPAAETGNHETSEDQTSTRVESVNKTLKLETPVSTDYSLPPFDPSNPVGMEFLVPKTGFFCKACNRFYSGTNEAEINHCRTEKHYMNLQKYLQTLKMAEVTAKTGSS